MPVSLGEVVCPNATTNILLTSLDEVELSYLSEACLLKKWQANHLFFKIENGFPLH